MVKKAKKMRADELAVAQGLCTDRAEAARMILAGRIRIGNDHVIQRTTEMVPADVLLEIPDICPYVSRGAYKLKPALERYLPDFTGLRTLDVGASTGGFTDLMLQMGAKSAVTIDVGRGQLHAKLRNDERVTVFEKTNARGLPDDFLSEKADVAVTDVSFISVTKVMHTMDRLTNPVAWFFILIKPQFEAKKHETINGIVTDPEVRDRCIEQVISFAQNQFNWQLLSVDPCEISGTKGNQEFMAVFRKAAVSIDCPSESLKHED